VVALNSIDIFFFCILDVSAFLPSILRILTCIPLAP
jgi:hypothetical protein